VSTALISKTLTAKLPGGFPASAARLHVQVWIVFLVVRAIISSSNHLQKNGKQKQSRGVGALRIESVLLHACGVNPPSARLGSNDDAKKVWALIFRKDVHVWVWACV